jgi:hypothetical protein
VEVVELEQKAWFGAWAESGVVDEEVVGVEPGISGREAGCRSRGEAGFGAWAPDFGLGKVEIEARIEFQTTAKKKFARNEPKLE